MDPDLARRLIRERTGAEPATIELLGEGWDNVAYLVDREWVYRFPRGEAQAAYLANECACIHEVAGRLPALVSVAEVVGQPNAEFPWPVARHRYVPGTTAERARLTDAERRALARPLGEFLRALHDLDVGDLRDDWIGRMDPAKRVEPARKRLDALAAKGVIPEPGPWLPLLAPLPPSPLPPTPLHGDFYCRQILVAEDRTSLAGVIDWGDMHLGDPACDLMVAFTFAPRDAFEGGYGPIDDATAKRARFRALSHTLGVTAYAHEIGDADLLREGRAALKRLATAGG